MNKQEYFDYYKSELDYIGQPDEYGATIVINANGKSTKYLTLNQESINALTEYFENILNKGVNND